MGDEIGTEPEAPTVSKDGLRGGVKDTNISLRLPSKLLAEIDQVSAGNGAGRSEFIRDVLVGVLAMARAGYSESQTLELKRGFVSFIRWVSDPIESIFYMMYRFGVAVSPPDFQRDFAMMLAQRVLAFANEMDSEQIGSMFGVFQDRCVFDAENNEENAEIIADAFLETIRKYAPTGSLRDRMEKTWQLSDEDTRDEDEGEE